jgi:single-strand DNA-binding protein
MQNIVILAGNIGQKPETRTTQGGTNITNFSLATSRPRLSEGRVLRVALPLNLRRDAFGIEFCP